MKFSYTQKTEITKDYRTSSFSKILDTELMISVEFFQKDEKTLEV